jgi:tetraprenyl-beta-curcumene synthase
VRANARYWPTVHPHVRRELRQWERRASEIADPALRAHALGKLQAERFNAEVAATLQTLAPRQHRPEAITVTVAFQVIYDYLDAVSEQPAADPLCNGRSLYRAFDDALSETPPVGSYYRHHDPLHRDDGGYLEALVATCRRAFGTLPAAAAVAPVARRTAARCGEAQTRTHAIPRKGVDQLATWAAAESPDAELRWWEVSAGAAASVLSVHALIAAAADPHTTTSDALRIDAAYLPISALTTLLDSLVDYEADTRSGSHRYLSYYEDAAAAAGRIGVVARRGAAAATTLPHADHHAMTVAGAAAYYLSAPGAHSAFARPIARHVIDELRPLVVPTLAIFHVWRRVKRLGMRRRRAVVRRGGSPHVSPVR